MKTRFFIILTALLMLVGIGANAQTKYYGNVENSNTDKVKLNKTKAYLEKGKTLTLKATVYPSSLEDKSVSTPSNHLR